MELALFVGSFLEVPNKMKDFRSSGITCLLQAARDKILAMASKGSIKLAATWKPTALIAIINGRKDISDLDKIRLAARAKMEGNLGDLLPKKFSAGAGLVIL